MNPMIVKVVHLVAVFGVFLGLGASLVARDEAGRKFAGMLHGIFLLVLALAGFAMLKKPPMDQHWWMVKVGLWVVLGASPVFVKRGILPRGVLVVLFLVVGAAAAYLGLAKPF